MSDVSTPPQKLTKEQWLRELESGRHAQMHGHLFTPEVLNAARKAESAVPPDVPSCCIGVAPKILGFKFGDRAGSDANSYYLIEDFTFEDKDIAVHWNDVQRLTFPQIAAMFRDRWNLPLQPSVSSNPASIVDPAPQIDNEP